MTDLKISDVMTPMPLTVSADLTVSEAESIMRDKSVRHLPVLESGNLVGVISDRDIRVSKAFRGPGELVVKDIMMPEPYCVGQNSHLRVAISTMFKRKIGSALVLSETGVVVGIFTVQDALAVLKDTLKTKTGRARHTQTESNTAAEGAILLIVHRRLFESDEPRFFIGEVETLQGTLAQLTGYTWYYPTFSDLPIKKEEKRTKIVSLSTGAILAYKLPDRIDLSTARFELIEDGRLWLKADPDFQMDMTESHHIRRTIERSAA